MSGGNSLRACRGRSKGTKVLCAMRPARRPTASTSSRGSPHARDRPGLRLTRFSSRVEAACVVWRRFSYSTGDRLLPAIRLVHAPLIAHGSSLPSLVGCSVISVSHSRFGRSAGEVPLDDAVVHRRAGTSGGAALLGLRGVRPCRAGQAVHPVAAGHDTARRPFMGDEPVPRFCVVVVDVRRGADQARAPCQSRTATGRAREV